MRKFLLSALAILLAMGLMGASFAYFSDTETSTGNSFTAGTWDLVLGGDSLPIKTKNMAPGVIGDEDQSEKHEVHNVGSLPGEVWLTAETFTDPLGNYAEPDEPESGGFTDVTPEDFAKVLYMKIEADLDHDDVFETELYDGPVYGMESDPFSIEPGEWIECKFTAYLPEDLDDPLTGDNEDDNLYQADGVRFEIVWHGSTEITIE